MYKNCVDIARRSSASGRQTTLRWQKHVFIHTRLSRAYLALARLSCLILLYKLVGLMTQLCTGAGGTTNSIMGIQKS